MPQMIGARFECVGHRDARLDGVRLDFTRAGEPCDSVVWLRNGGGKSSILNLLFSVLRPSQREFLGSEAEARVRELSDYVAPGDVAIVALAFRLDVGPDAEEEHAVVGACMERSGPNLERMFFAVRVASPATTPFGLDDLPLFDTQGGRQVRRRANALREALLELQRDDLRVQTTTTQRQWAQILDGFGIDPELFSYQLDMNRREGAADEIFRFANSLEFTDFLMEVAFDPEDANLVAKNLAELRAKIQGRPRLLTEREALFRAEGLLVPAAELGASQMHLRNELVAATEALCDIRAGLEVGATSCRRRTQAAREEVNAQLARQSAAEKRKFEAVWWGTVLQARRAQIKLDLARDAAATLKHGCEEADREVTATRLAHRLDGVHAVESRARERRKYLDERLREHGPLLHELNNARQAYARSLAAERAVADVRLSLIKGEVDRWTSSRDAAQTAARDAVRLHSRAQADLATIEHDEKRLREQRTDLERQDVLATTERTVDAEARIETSIQALESADVASRERCLELTERRRASDERFRDLHTRLTQVDVEVSASEQRLDGAATQRARLERDRLLCQILEDDSPSLTSSSDVASARLASHEAALHEELLALQIEEHNHGRVLDSLERRELLPASVDAERVHRTLRDAGIDAHLGGSWLAENARREERADACVRRHPEIVAGVIVSEKDLPRARAILTERATELSVGDVPIVVATGTELLADAPERAVAMPSRAAYDRSAAIRERERRRQQRSARNDRIANLRNEHRACSTLRQQVTAFLAQYPGRWFDDTAAELDARRALRTSLASQRQVVAEQVTECDRHLDAENAETARRSGLRRSLDRALAKLQAFRKNGGDRLERIELELSRARDVVAERANDVSRADEALLVLAAEGERLQEQRRERVQRQQALSKEQNELGAVLVGEGEAPPLDAARHAFDDLRRLYDKQTGGEALRGEVEADERRARDERDAFTRECDRESVTEDDVAAVLDRALSSIGLNESERSARAAARELHRRYDAAKGELTLAQDAAKRAEDAVSELRQRASALDELRARAACLDGPAVDAALSDNEVASSEARQEIEDASARASEAKELAQHAEGVALQLEAALQRAKDGCSELPLDERNPVTQRLRAVLMRQRTADAVEDPKAADHVLETLRRTRAELVSLDRQIEEHARKLSTFALGADGAALPPLLRERISADGIEDLFRRAADYLQDVTLRRATIEDELRSIEDDRTMLASSLQRATDPALRLVRRLQDASVFPESVASWGGEPFIRVALQLPEANVDREARALTVIDQIIETGNVPSGLQLVQRLMHELARGHRLEIKILKPEAHRRLHYETIERLRSFSRGEQLTAAILLYCTLAHLRALERGRRRHGTSVLVLDNPIGTCSGPSLIDLQRSMAAAHRVQLIYTTGIEDMEALSRMPRLIRLRNDHQDGRGRRHVTVAEPRPLEVATIAHRTLS